MNLRHLFPLLLLLWAPVLRAAAPSFGDTPIEINVGSGGEVHFAANGVAVAERNVIIHYGSASIYADYAQYNPATRDVLLIGNVRLYREGRLATGDRVLYNLETKVLRAADFRSEVFPLFFQADAISSMEGDAFQVNNAVVTTSDSSKPDYQFKARKVQIYPKNKVVLSDVTLYVGHTPVFWVPQIDQPLRQAR